MTLDRKSIFSFFFCLWVLVVLVGFVFFMRTSAPWAGMPILAKEAGLASIYFILAYVFSFLLNRLQLNPAWFGLAVLPGLYFILLKPDNWIRSIQFVVFFIGSYLCVEGFRFLTKKIFSWQPDFFLSTGLFLVFLQMYLFSLISLGQLKEVPVLFPIYFLIALGAGGLFIERGEWLQSAREVLSANRIYFILFISYLATIVGSSLFQTYSDGVVSVLPQVRAMAENHAFPEHYMNWGRLTVSALQLLMTAPYFWGGFQAVAWFCSLFFLLSLLSMSWFMPRLGWSQDSVATAVALISVLAPVWVFSTTVYADIPLFFFLFLSLAIALQIRKESSIWDFMIWGFLAGFTTTVKLNAVLFQGILFLTVWLLKPEVRKKQICFYFLAVLFSLVPWYMRTYLATGNPFFPFLSNFFVPKIGQGSVFTSEATAQFTYYFYELPLYFWQMTFQTGKFGELFDGSFGPLFLILFPGFVYFFFSAKIRDNRNYKIILIVSLLFLLGSLFVLKMAYFRYVLFSVLMFVFLLLEPIFEFLNKTLGSIQTRALFFIVLLFQVVFLFGFSVRINYLIPEGIGLHYYLNSKAEADYRRLLMQGVDDFINERQQAQDVVICSNYQFVYTLKPSCIYFSEKKSALGSFLTLDSFNQLVERYRIKYWIVNKVILSDEVKQSPAYQTYVVSKKPVFQSEVYDIYQIREH